MSKTKRLATMSVAVALAMILSYLESLIPTFIPVPGIKPGFANIAVIFVLYRLGAPSAIGISVVRVLLTSLLFGSPISMIYSTAGALFSFGIMLLLKRFTPFGTIGVSVAGGVCHNVAQIAVASLMLGTNVVAYYLPFLIISGTVAGIAVGVASAILVKKVRL